MNSKSSEQTLQGSTTQPSPFIAPRGERSPIFSGLVIIGALLLILAFTKKFLPQRAGSAEESIKVLARKACGPRQAFLIVEVKGRTLFVGQTEGQLNCLADLSADPAFEDSLESSLFSETEAPAGPVSDERRPRIAI